MKGKPPGGPEPSGRSGVDGRAASVVRAMDVTWERRTGYTTETAAAAVSASVDIVLETAAMSVAIEAL